MKTRLTIAILFVISIAACKNKNGEQDDNKTLPSQEQTIAEVDTLVLTAQTFQKQILCNGRLAAIQRAELTCPNNGDILQSITVHNGQRVSKGQLLAISETREKSSALEKARYDFERATVELQDKLIGLGYDVASINNGDWQSKIPADILKRAEITSGYYSAKLAVESATNDLTKCKLIAPFSGRIADLVARQHQRSDKFCTLIDDSYFDVEFKVLEAELSSVQKGTTVKVSPLVDEEKVFEGNITEINPTVDAKGLVKVVARIKNTDEEMLDGMNVRVIIENSVSNMLIVPKDAVVERDGYHVVFLYNPKNNRAIWTYVDIAYSNLNSFAITGCKRKDTELHEGDIVIVTGNLNLADDTEVRITKQH